MDIQALVPNTAASFTLRGGRYSYTAPEYPLSMLAPDGSWVDIDLDPSHAVIDLPPGTYRNVPVDIFLDSVNGSDSNSGATPDQAVATVSAITLTDGLSIGIARGSYFLEQLGDTSGTIDNITVIAYGTGVMPVFDGREVASADGWTLSAGQTKTYQRTWTHDNVSGQFLSLWANDSRVRWYSSIANCEAATGPAFYAATTSSGSTIVYYHPAGDLNPATDGVTVKISKRAHGIRAADGWTVRGMHTKCTLHNDGSLKAGNDCVIEDCLFEDGTKHNMFMEASIARRCGAWKCDWPERTNATFFVGYTDNGVGKAVTFENCWVLGEQAQLTYAIGAAKGMDGFYAHNANGTDVWDTVTYEGCTSKLCTIGFTAASPSHQDVIRCKAEAVNDGCLLTGPDAYAEDLWVLDGDVTKVRVSAQINTGAVAVIDGLRAYTSRGGDNRGDVYNPNAATVTLQNSVIRRVAGSTGTRWGLNSNTTAGVANINHCILQYVVTTDIVYRRVTGVTGAADNNNYYPDTCNFQVGATSYNDFAAYKAANPTLDQASTTHDPQFTDPANGDWTIGNATLAALGVGLDRDVTSRLYTPIPSNPGAL